MEDTLSPPQTESGAGFESTRVRQFIVFLANRVGRLQQLVRALEEADIRIVAISIEESSETSLIRLICSDGDLGREVLNREKFSFAESDLLLVEVPRKTTQPLVAICSALLSAEIGIHYAYPLLHRPKGPALAMYVDEPTLAAEILIRKGFTLLGESDLKG